jgi:hypothetical protein
VNQQEEAEADEKGRQGQIGLDRRNGPQRLQRGQRGQKHVRGQGREGRQQADEHQIGHGTSVQ